MFHRNGYANATLVEIATAAGVTKGALYFHFASKDELADAVQQRGCGLLHEAVRVRREAGASPLQTLIDTTYWLARMLHEDPAVPASFRITKECAGVVGADGAVGAGVDFHGAVIGVVSGLLRMARDVGELGGRVGGADGVDGVGVGAGARVGVGVDGVGAGGAGWAGGVGGAGVGVWDAGRWEGAEALVGAAVCGIEIMSGTGMSYWELQRKVAALWGLLLPSLVGEGRVAGYRTEGPGRGV
ncbi:TetR family transcriptional regulator [Streptomyces sp. NPDC059443]